MSLYLPIAMLRQNRLNCLFLDQVELKERKDPTTFHQNMQLNKAKLAKCYTSNPDFAEIVKLRVNNVVKKKEKPKVVFRRSTLITMIKQSQSAELITTDKSSRNNLNSLPVIKISNNNGNPLINDSSKNEVILNETEEIPPSSRIRKISQKSLTVLNESRNKQKGLCQHNSNANQDKANTELLTKTNPSRNISLRKSKQLHNIYQRCISEIQRGESLDHDISKSTEKLDQKITTVHDKKKILTTVSKDKKVITEEKKKRGKYDILRDINLAIQKKRLNQQISEGLAYTNKAGFIKSLNACKVDSYQLFLIDLNRDEKKIKRQRRKEDSQAELITKILDSTVKDKEILKAKIEMKDEIYKQDSDKNKKLGKTYRSRSDISRHSQINSGELELIKDDIKEKYTRKH